MLRATLADPVFLDHSPEMSMAEQHHEELDDGIGDDEKEDIEEEGLGAEGKDIEGGLVLSDEVEGGEFGHESGE